MSGHLSVIAEIDPGSIVSGGPAVELRSEWLRRSLDTAQVADSKAWSDGTDLRHCSLKKHVTGQQVQAHV